ncbi:hypothetical protein A6V36_17350 [Paraburkholderia ginsengiterrae]|uniref:Uncharacterized protein n=1 Tax=Paraburkholderia ginsengiterrae TaxID=1462993 RepID=A0A1A9NDT2_9BURK|nr:hypothetical protein A6V36_17350 [Paraburkholderia ginsengiterrae]OAJ65142.1 hypothetical protein A6V37_15780 [Paraburkholderia ginsengiterrae]
MAARMLTPVNGIPGEKSLMLRAGSAIDATLIYAPGLLACRDATGSLGVDVMSGAHEVSPLEFLETQESTSVRVIKSHVPG